MPRLALGKPGGIGKLAFRDLRLRSASVDAPGTMVVNVTRVEVCAWCDDEWGHARRHAAVVREVAGLP